MRWVRLFPKYLQMSLPRIGERLGDGQSVGNGFTRLEYLQSSGTQWIDTGVFADQDCEAIVECSANDFYQHYIFGARTNVKANDMFCFILGMPQMLIRNLMETLDHMEMSFLSLK